jgi:hypothetical protein
MSSVLKGSLTGGQLDWRPPEAACRRGVWDPSVISPRRSNHQPRSARLGSSSPSHLSCHRCVQELQVALPQPRGCCRVS